MEMHYCPKCHGTKFYAHQMCRLDIIVDGNNIFYSGTSSDTASDIYDAETPYGPYTCVTCHTEYDTLEELPVADTVVKAELKVPRDKAEYIRHLLSTEPCSEEECLNENETIIYTVDFDDEMSMDIKVCGVQFIDEEGMTNMPWTEAVLFDKGCEVVHSEPSEDFFGEWELTDDDKTYQVTVVAEE